MRPAAQCFTRVASALCLVTLCLVTLSGWTGDLLQAESPATAQDEAPLVAALDAQARRPPVSYTARRRLDGELLDKGERGWMEVLTRFDPANGVRHQVLAEGGSARIRSRALASVLSKEIEVHRDEEARHAAFSSENYRYRLVAAPWETARIELMPLRSDARLLKGTALVDPENGALLKVEGQLSANPSFWVRDVHIARTYARVGSSTLPVELVSTARVRMFGAARLRIRNEYLLVDGQAIRDTGVMTLASKFPAN